ncbi:hypothetical protein D1871_16895 [Nakamurella silvestris]|nr:hypothetical protein D1871_16895 [Nakamurella silvestris]
MTVTGSWFHALSVLLVLAGLAKIRSPRSIGPTLTALGLPRSLTSRAAARLIGTTETVIGLVGLAVGNRPSAAVVLAAYLTLTVVAVHLVRADSAADCGCFGAARSPMNRTHVVVDLGFTIAAATAVVAPPGSLAEAWGEQNTAGLPYLLLVGALTVVGYLLFTALPALHEAGRGQERATGAPASLTRGT